jgi:hypothetical protein
MVEVFVLLSLLDDRLTQRTMLLHGDHVTRRMVMVRVVMQSKELLLIGLVLHLKLQLQLQLLGLDLAHRINQCLL